MKLNQATGALAMDDAFHESEGKPGFNLRTRTGHGMEGIGLHARSYSPVKSVVDCHWTIGSGRRE